MTSRSDFLFVEEIALMCRVPAGSVRYWLSTAKLASVRPGRRRVISRLCSFLVLESEKPVETGGGL
jgi:hypothetical protein